MGIYPEETTPISLEDALKEAHGEILYHLEQIEESEAALADLLFDFRWDYGEEVFNKTMEKLGVDRSIAQAYLNVGLTNFMEFLENVEEEERE